MYTEVKMLGRMKYIHWSINTWP